MKNLKLNLKAKIVLMAIILVLSTAISITLISHSHSKDLVKKQLIEQQLPLFSAKIQSLVSEKLLDPTEGLTLLSQDPLLHEWIQKENQPVVTPEPTIDELGNVIINQPSPKVDPQLMYAKLRAYSKFYQLNGADFISNLSLTHLKLFEDQEESVKIQEDTQWYWDFIKSTQNTNVNVYVNDEKFGSVAFINQKILQGEQIIGVLSAAIDLKKFVSTLTTSTIGTQGRTYAIDAQGIVRVHKDSTLLNKHQINDQYASFISDLLNKGQHFQETTDLPGNDIYLISQYIPELDWYLMIEASQEELLSPINQQLWKNLITASLMIALGVLLSFILTSSFLKPIKNILERMNQIAEGDGDLTQRLEVQSKDEVGQLAQSFNVFVEKIQTLVLNNKRFIQTLHEVSTNQIDSSELVNDNTQTMQSNSAQMGQTSQMATQKLNSIVGSIETMNHSVTGVATAMGEMSQTVNEISQNCNTQSNITTKANAQTQEANEKMQKLEATSSQIVKILDVIKKIASQTNLLALNASIEAASAGDAGRGFAVVANEVKELATQTSQATEEISAQINDIITNTKSSAEALKDITGVINEVTHISHTIASAVEEQSATVNEISNNMTMIKDESTHVTSNVHESVHGIDEINQSITTFDESLVHVMSNLGQVNQETLKLSDIAEELKKSFDSFKV